MNDTTFYNIMEIVNKRHNDTMRGEKWTQEQDTNALKQIMRLVCDSLGVNPQEWQDTLNDCYDGIAELAERYPTDYKAKERNLSRVIDELWEINK